MHNFTTLPKFSDGDNDDDDVFIFSAPFKSKPQSSRGGRENSARVICIAFFGVWLGSGEGEGEGEQAGIVPKLTS